MQHRFPAAKSPVVTTATGTTGADDDDEDDFELFGSDEDEVDEAVEKLKQERLAAYEAKRANSLFFFVLFCYWPRKRLHRDTGL